jgi:hypothetical protein
VTFEAYAGQMGAIVNNMARKQARRHPLLAMEDLRQEALLALWNVWETKRDKVTNTEHLCKLGTLHVRRDLHHAIRKILKGREHSVATTHTIDAGGVVRSTQDKAIKHLPSTQETYIEQAYLAHGLAEIDRMLVAMSLTPGDRDVVWEMLEPSAATICGLRDRWKARLDEVRNGEKLTTVTDHLAAIADTLDRTPKSVNKSWRKVWIKTKTPLSQN